MRRLGNTAATDQTLASGKIVCGQGFQDGGPAHEVVRRLRGQDGSRSGLIDAHVIDEQLARELRILGQNIAVEVAADGQVENRVEVMVEYPIAVFLDIAFVHRIMQGTVYIESDLVFVPFDREYVEIIHEARRAVRQGIEIVERIVAEVSGTVNGGAGYSGQAATVFHDVEFAAVRPT